MTEPFYVDVEQGKHNPKNTWKVNLNIELDKEDQSQAFETREKGNITLSLLFRRGRL